MAVNSFHKYVSAIRKSKSFKPVIQSSPYFTCTKVIAVCKDTRLAFGPMLLEEIQTIISKHSIVITTDYDTREMYAYDFWLF